MKINEKRHSSLSKLLNLSLTASMTVNALELSSTFRDTLGYKNIAFGAYLGGSSHYNWVLAIGDELVQRGHNFAFLTWEGETRFGKPYSHIKTVSIGPGAEYDRVEFMRSMSDPKKDTLVMMFKAMMTLRASYGDDYRAILSYFRENNIDLALCDQFTNACVDAALTANIPFIITEPVDITQETAAPFINNGLFDMADTTTEHQTFAERFHATYIYPYMTLYKIFPYLKQIKAYRDATGIEVEEAPPRIAWKDSIKLVNVMHGFAAPRKISPMAELIGPIIPKRYINITIELESYLNEHKRVAYAAFGQNSLPTENDIQLILTGLLENLETGLLDAFLWATKATSESFPETITTSSGRVYIVREMFDGTHPHARVIDWAPQAAVLMHPSTTLFVSHGGLVSWYEAMYAGKPMVLFPFFGDQPGNALLIERGDMGRTLKRDGTIAEAINVIKYVAEDKDGLIKAGCQRNQALAQIHTNFGIIRGANVVEEVAYTHRNGKLLHREPADRRMSYIKAHNLDLYAALALIVLSILSTAFFAAKMTYHVITAKISSKRYQKKLKNL